MIRFQRCPVGDVVVVWHQRHRGRVGAGDAAVRVDEPSYAAPCWADIDGDGLKDLLVGQFANGNIRVYKNLGDAKLAPGKLLEADGEVAVVPGVW